MGLGRQSGLRAAAGTFVRENTCRRWVDVGSTAPIGRLWPKLGRGGENLQTLAGRERGR